MARDKQEQYEQDRLGNVYRKLDTLRGARGQVEESPTEGLLVIASGDTDSDLALFSQPTDAEQLIVTEVWGFNSGPSGNNSFHLIEGEPDGAGALTNTTRRSVDIVVDSAATRREEYSGESFTDAIGVNSEFAGQVAVGIIEDHRESSEQDVEQTTT